MPFSKGLLEVRESCLGGFGLFAKVDIPANTVIWRYSIDAEDLNSWENLGDGPNRAHSEDELKELESKDQAALTKLLWGGYLHEPSG